MPYTTASDLKTTAKKILVFNWHEPYICLYAQMGHLLYVAAPPQQPTKKWNQGFRPLPKNATEISWEAAQDRVGQGQFDLVLCLTLHDLETVAAWDVPRLFVMLNMIGTDSGHQGAAKESFINHLRPSFQNIDIAFISEKKRRDWGWQAPVVVSGVDPADYGGYQGDIKRILRVGNMLKERDHMQGFSIQEKILEPDLPSTILGVNPELPLARASRDWDDLKNTYKNHRLLLNTLTETHEDGYNLAVLEAMATGMPIVSTVNSSSPIVDGYNGFISDDYDYLRSKIRLLLDDHELAVELGRNARQTVIENFHIATCMAGWDAVFDQCIEAWQQRRPVAVDKSGSSIQTIDKIPPNIEATNVAAGVLEKEGRRLKILLLAPANPLSTSAYYETALRRSHDVLSCGPRLNQETLEQWKMWEGQHAFKATGTGDVDKMGLLSRLVHDCDIALPWGDINAAQLSELLPADWQPDLVLWIDAGPDFRVHDLAYFDCPTACLMGDTHTDKTWRLEYARQFEQVFLMFARQDIPIFTAAGCRQVEWLPAACEPQIHRHFEVSKAYDIVFVGQTLPQWHAERVRLLKRLELAGFDLRVDSKILEEMALLYARGRIVFNRSLNGDLNMRVFEAMACGSLLLTDRLSAEAGQEMLFTDRQHFVLYGEQDLEELARFYLDNPRQREEIAVCGREEVLAKHTYGHRADQILARIFGTGVCSTCVESVDISQDKRRQAIPGSGESLPVAKAEEKQDLSPVPAALPEYYRNTRPEIIALVPPQARKVLDLGCGAGEMGRVLQETRPGTEVVGIELNPEAAGLAREKLAVVIHANIESLEFLPFPEGYFDCITTGDVLEHLTDPEAVLERLLKYLSPQGVLVCSIPNIRHQSVLLDLAVNGRWQYKDEGILDRTHLRFFTLVEIRQMLERLGLVADKMTASQSPPIEAMEPFFEVVAKLGGDAEALRQEAQIIQYIFQARSKETPKEFDSKAKVRARVIIPVFNQASFTETCLYAIAGNTGTDPDYETVVVDNGSTDWTRYLLHALEGDIQVVDNTENLGFAKACNQGTEGATTEYLLFLNNDTVPQEGWLAEMVALADSDPQIGVVGAKLVYPDSFLIQHAGIAMVNGLPEHVFRGVEANEPQVNQVRDYDMVTGACLMIRRAVFNQVGGFDTAYLNGVEDVDLCLKVRAAGYRVVYCPTSVVAHHEGQSEGRYDKVKENLQHFLNRWQDSFDANGLFQTPMSKSTLATSPQFATNPRTEDSIEDADTSIEELKAETLQNHVQGPALALDTIGRVHWHGAFFSHSSLAYVNRELTLRLIGLGLDTVALEPFGVDQFEADEDPRFKDLAERFTTHRDPNTNISVRHRWPPDFTPVDQGRLVIYQPWEFGRIPQSWVQPLDEHVDQIWAYTTYVRNCYIDSGIDPHKVKIVPLGIDPEQFKPGLEPLALSTQKTFKFLFVGGTLYRKGIDVLLDAYASTFTPEDDVCLVIKDMGTSTFYRDQNAGDRIRAMQVDAACPEILYLTEDLAAVDMPHLYAACDSLVHPYRGEGFGLPVAEAMACGLPVIVTAGGACDDFCQEDTAYLIPAQRQGVNFSEATVGQAWLSEPDLNAVKKQMRAVFEMPDRARQLGWRAAAWIRSQFSWEQATLKVGIALKDIIDKEDKSAIASSNQKTDPLSTDEAVIAADIDFVYLPGACPLRGTEEKARCLQEVQTAAVGAQLEVVRKESENSFLLIVDKGVEVSLATLAMLRTFLIEAPDVAMVHPIVDMEDSVLSEEGMLTLGCVLFRRSALQVIGGFDGSFCTFAVVDNAVRICERHGLRVMPVHQVQVTAESNVDTLLIDERKAVTAIAKGDRFRDEKNYEAALVHYQEAVVSKADFVEAILVLGDLLLTLKRASEAALVVKRLIDLDPHSSWAWNYLGLAQYQGNETLAARLSFTKALELDEAFSGAMMNLGVLEWDEGNEGIALEYFEKVLVLDPTNRDLIINLGMIYAKQGKLIQATELLARYLQDVEQDLDIKALLADVMEQNAQLMDSRQLAEEIVAVAPEHARAKAVLARINDQEKPKEE